MLKNKSSIKASDILPVIDHVITNSYQRIFYKIIHTFFSLQFCISVALLCLSALAALLLLCLHCFVVAFLPCAPLPYLAGSEIKRN